MCDELDKENPTMNNKQKIVFWIGIAAIVLMGIFPPWIAYQPSHGWGYDRGYKFLLRRPPKLSTESSLMPMIDLPRLAIQWILVAVITGGLLVTLKDEKKD